MHLSPRLGIAIGAISLLLGGSLPVAQVVSAHSEVVGHVYVNDNTAVANTVGAFHQHRDGSLTATPASPFAAGGAGTGTIVGSMGALQKTDYGRFLLAVDTGSNQISVLRVGSDGTLAAVGSPVGSGGIAPVSIAIHTSLVYVANEGDGTSGSNYTGFTLSSTGALSPLSNSTVPLPPTAAPVMSYSIPRQADRTLLGRDHPGRSIPVRRQYRGSVHFELQDPRGRQPVAAGQHGLQ